MTASRLMISGGDLHDRQYNRADARRIWTSGPLHEIRDEQQIGFIPTLIELAQLGKQALLVFVAQVLAELAAPNARVAALLMENAALKAQLEQRQRDAMRSAAPFSKGRRRPQPKRPGRKPGRGHFTFRTLSGPDQWTTPPIEVRLPESICPCCGEPLQEQRVDFAATTDIRPQPKPIVPPYRVWVYRCPTCDTTVRAPHPDLAPDQYGATAHRIGPRVMAEAHATHYGFGVPARKVPAILALDSGVRLTQSAITQDASRRASGPIGRQVASGSVRPVSRARRSATVPGGPASEADEQ